MNQSLLPGFVLLLAFNSNGFTQENLANKQQGDNPCSRYKMRVVNPAENLDPKMVVKVDAQLDPRMVVNPCPAIPKIAVQTKPLPEQESNRKQNAVSPSLKFNLPNNESKTPSEILKQFSSPTTPKPNR